MDLDRIVSELRSERDRLSNAIALLEGESTNHRAKAARLAAATSAKRTGSLTPAGRRRLSEAMKRRWAAGGFGNRRKTRVAVVSSATPRKKGGLTPAGRKRLSEMMKKRWAGRRKKAS